MNELAVEIVPGAHSKCWIMLIIITVSAELAAFADSFHFTQSSPWGRVTGPHILLWKISGIRKGWKKNAIHGHPYTHPIDSTIVHVVPYLIYLLLFLFSSEHFKEVANIMTFYR